MSRRLMLVVAALIFLGTIVVRMPAGILGWFLPANTQCSDPGGTLWHGSCGELRAGAIALRDLQWQLQPLALLRLHVVAEITSPDPRAAGHARIDAARNGDLAIHDLSAQLPLQNGWQLFWPGWNGTLQLDLAAAQIHGGHLAALSGRAQLLHLQRASAPELGGFELDFAPSAEGSLGRLHDLGGPIAAEGSATLSENGQYLLQASLSARDGVGSDDESMLRLLGPADAAGHHTLSLSGQQ